MLRFVRLKDMLIYEINNRRLSVFNEYPSRRKRKEGVRIIFRKILSYAVTCLGRHQSEILAPNPLHGLFALEQITQSDEPRKSSQSPDPCLRGPYKLV